MPTEIDHPAALPAPSDTASGCHGKPVSGLQRRTAGLLDRVLDAPPWACALFAGLALAAAVLLALH